MHPPRIDFKVGQKETRSPEGLPLWEPVDLVVITPFGSAGKDSVTKEYATWLQTIRPQVSRGIGSDVAGVSSFESRFLPEWITRIEEAYAAWKRNEEIPVQGTALKNWAVIVPHYLQQCLANGIRSVEELAEIGDDLVAQLGMGGMALREQARQYVKINVSGANKAAAEISTLKAKLAEKDELLQQLSERLSALEASKPSKK